MSVYEKVIALRGTAMDPEDFGLPSEEELKERTRQNAEWQPNLHPRNEEGEFVESIDFLLDRDEVLVNPDVEPPSLPDTVIYDNQRAFVRSTPADTGGRYRLEVRTSSGRVGDTLTPTESEFQENIQGVVKPESKASNYSESNVRTYMELADTPDPEPVSANEADVVMNTNQSSIRVASDNVDFDSVNDGDVLIADTERDGRVFGRVSVDAELRQRNGMMTLEQSGESSSVTLRRSAVSNLRRIRVDGGEILDAFDVAIDPESVQNEDASGKVETILGVVEEFENEFGVSDEMRQITIGPIADSGAKGGYSGKNRNLLFQPSSLEGSLDSEIAYPDTAREVAIHEMGHVMHFRNAAGGKAPRSSFTPPRLTLDDDARDQIVNEVSDYANWNRMEFVAELFAKMRVEGVDSLSPNLRDAYLEAGGFPLGDMNE